MSKKTKKPLLNEGTVRRMMKLANMDALGDSFITEKWGSKEGEYKRRDVDGVEKKAGDVDHHYKDYEDITGQKKGDKGAHGDTDYSGKGMRKGDKSDTGRGKDFVNEEDEEEKELDATEDELGDMDAEADRERDELEADEEAMEDEVSITDEEAQDIIDLADKLRAAMGEEGEAEEEVEAEMDMGDEEVEMDMDIEEPGMRDMMEEELYEAALRGLDIEVVDDKAEQRAALMEQAKAKIYERVIKRLLKESKK